jgi:hypothetical protein
MFLRNVGIHLKDYTMIQIKREFEISFRSGENTKAEQQSEEAAGRGKDHLVTAQRVCQKSR